MSDPWKRAADKAKAVVEGNGDFLKLKDGQKVVGVFLGDPSMVVFADGKSHDLDSPEGLAAEKAGAKARFQMSFYDLEAKKLTRWTMSATVFEDQLLKVREKYGLDKWAVEIERKGVALDTKYTILPDHELSDEERASLPSPKATTSTGTIDEGKAQALINRLKQLPDEDRAAFLDQFELVGKRVRDLPAARATEAVEFVAELETKRDAASVDPFAM